MGVTAEYFEAVILAEEPDISCAELARRLIERFPRSYLGPIDLPEFTDALPGPDKVPYLCARAQQTKPKRVQLWHPLDPTFLQLDRLGRPGSHCRNGQERWDREVELG
jgi:hypothetical protein